MHKKYCNRTIGWLLFYSMSLLAWVGTAAATSQINQHSKTTEASMNLASQTAVDVTAIPPIDAAVPAITETASFGLG